MQPQVLAKSRVGELVAALAKDRRVVAPVAKENQFVFAELTDPGQVRLDYPISVLSPKKYFFPQYETLLKFDRASPAPAAAELNAEPTAIFGMHPCDITSTWLLDKVFATKNPDANYLAKRDRALIIGLDCPRPCDDKQFCLDMGSLYPARGYDLFLQDLGDRYFVTVASEAGQTLVEKNAKLFAPAGSADQVAQQQFAGTKTANFARKLPFDAARLPQLLGDSYDSLIWDAVARRCFSCGSCNLVCPTCYCFTVGDDLAMNLKTGERNRRWDACQLRDFAEVAGGENFREQAAARLRHRVFRKGKYMKEQFGESGCVGCGRCDRHCVASISIRKTFEQLWESQTQKQAEKEKVRQQAAAKPASQYVPRVGQLVEVANFTEREKWFKVRFSDGGGLNHLPGQFVEVSLFGIGEAPISICSANDGGDSFEMCVRAVGDVSNQMHQMAAGQTIGIRGPFGNGFDVKQIAGQDVVFVAGGLGLAPCRSFIQAVLNDRDKYGKVTILYGARNPKELLFRADLQTWARRADCDLRITVDRPDEGWVGNVGVITTLFKQIKMDPNRTAVFIIGPPVMFKYAVMEVLALGVPEAKVLCSLERRMKCGLGKCGHCQIRDIYVCQDGPVFTYQQVKRMREGI